MEVNGAVWENEALEQKILEYHFDRPPYLTPRIIDELGNQEGERGDQIISINLSEIGKNRFYGEIIKEADKISIIPEDFFHIPYMWYEYIGKTDDGIYILKKGRQDLQSILLIEFQKERERDWKKKPGVTDSSKKQKKYVLAYEGKERILIKKLCEIPAPADWDGNASLAGRTLYLGNMGKLEIEDRYSRKFRMLFQAFLGKDVNYASLPWVLHRRPYISPRVIDEMMSWMSDEGDQVVSINLIDSQQATRYRCKKHKEFYLSYEENEETCSGFPKPWFGYRYIGQTDSGVHVIETASGGGASGCYHYLLWLQFERDWGMSVDWEKKSIQQDRERILIKKLYEVGLGDRWGGKLKVKGNTVCVGRDQGIFAKYNFNASLIEIEIIK